MKLDRNTTQPPRGKCALVKLRDEEAAEAVLNPAKGSTVAIIDRASIDTGSDPDSEFFVVRLKDKYAEAALTAYALAAAEDGDTEYAAEVQELARRAREHPNKRKPD